MPIRRNKTKFRNALSRNSKENKNVMVKQTRKRAKKPPAPSGGDTSEDETLQNVINKRTEVSGESLNSTQPKSTTLPNVTPTPTVSSPPNSLEKVNDIIIKTKPNDNIKETPKSSLSPSIIVQEIIATTSYDLHCGNCDQNKTDIHNTIEVGAQIHASNIDELDAKSVKQTFLTTSKISNPISCEPDTIEILSMQSESFSTQPLLNMSTSELLSLPVIVTEEKIIIEGNNKPLDAKSFDNKDAPTTLILAPSTNTREIVIRSSHDLEDNIIVEEVDIDPMNIEQSLDTSTPLGSPSTSTIIRIDTENLSFSNINTPTSSMCANSPINDENYEPSDCGSDTTEDINTERKQTKRKRKVKKKTDLGRIRKVKRDEWIDSQRKNFKNQGLAYISRGGKERPAKSLLTGCDDKCRLKCKQKITENIRKLLFKQFWSLGNRVRQWELLSRWCERIGKKRMTTEGPSKRKFSVRYYLPRILGNDYDKEERVLVCKKMFLDTFAIGEGVVRTALNKIADGDGLFVESDMRGHHNNHPKVKNDEMVKNVCDHVKSFTPIEAHYTRKESSKLYLDSDLTMSKMFKLYEEWVAGSNSNKAKTLRQYTDIVNENFNIEFHRPKKDQCDECTVYKNLPRPINQDDQDRYDEHIRNKDLARSLKNEDKLSALRSPSTTVTAAFDFQKVHSAPHAESSILYYKRKLNVFNFTIFEMGQKVGKCYMWHEGTAKRGANEVASCVYDFIKDQSSKGILNINLYSDNCGGQNRNRIVFMMYLVAAKKFNVNITHRFLEKGHTQNENDSIHALIERCAKNKEIYTPEQWFALVRWAKETGNPYTVKEIATEDILDFKRLLKGKNWAKNQKNQKILWSRIREINVTSTEPDVINYKNQFDESYQHLIVCRAQNRRRQDQTNEELTQAYTGPLPIPHAKIADLKYLCEHNVIPRQYHAFFNSLEVGDIDEQSESDED